MKFTKMHGCGNDYVYVNGFAETIKDPGAVSRYVSDRHFGIGSDGLIIICPSEQADFRMDMYNADGSKGAMCGNGIRCVAKYVYDFGLTDKQEIRVETGSGIKTLQLSVCDGKVEKVRVDMGAPDFCAEHLPVAIEKKEAVNFPLDVEGETYRFTGVSMGNPHAVVFVGDVADFPVERIGSAFEQHKIFPDRVNAEFIQVLDDRTIKMRVWERGSGETLACGTGACAAAVASIRTGRVKGPCIEVRLLGGTLQIEWDQQKNTVFMTGPATMVYTGEISLPEGLA